MSDVVQQIAKELKFKPEDVQGAVTLIQDGLPISFIARYRKERTGNMGESKLRSVQEKLRTINELEARRQVVLNSIKALGKLDDHLAQAIAQATAREVLEDLYLPFGPKAKATAAGKAREHGLEPLAERMARQEDKEGSVDDSAAPFISAEKGIKSSAEALAGAREIIAEKIFQDPLFRQEARAALDAEGLLTAQPRPGVDVARSRYAAFKAYSEPLNKATPTKIMNMMRGESEGKLVVDIQAPREKIVEAIRAKVISPEGSIFADELTQAVAAAVDRLLVPELIAERRLQLKHRADEAAADVYGRTLRAMLSLPPFGSKRVLALAAVRHHALKAVVLDGDGSVIDSQELPLARMKPKGKGAKSAKGAKPDKAGDPAKTEAKAEADAATAEKTESTEAAQPAETVEPPAAPEQASTDAPAAEEPAAAGRADAPAHSAPLTSPAAAQEDATPAADAAETTPVAETPAADQAEKPAEPVKPEAPQGPTKAEIRSASREKLIELIKQHQIAALAIGNSATARDVESFLHDTLRDEAIAELRVPLLLVNDAGAAAYAAGRPAKKELPRLDATARTAVCIGRRLQDPLAELVKVNPKFLVSHQPTQELDSNFLRRKLGEVVESCVHRVGIDLNKASHALLSQVGGIGSQLARTIIDTREKNGPFKSREALRELNGLGPTGFMVAVGFLRVYGGDYPLDETAVHPECYEIVERMRLALGLEMKAMVGDVQAINKLKLEDFRTDEIGEFTLRDVFWELKHPGRDPRGHFALPQFDPALKDLNDLQEGMVLGGMVTNITDFGVFVDLGIRQDGLVHISELSHRYVRDPSSLLTVGKPVKVKVVGINTEKKRISLSIKALEDPNRREGGRGKSRGPRREPRGPGAPGGEGQPAREGGRGRASSGSPAAGGRGGAAAGGGRGGATGGGRGGSGRGGRGGAGGPGAGGPGAGQQNKPEFAKFFDRGGKKRKDTRRKGTEERIDAASRSEVRDTLKKQEKKGATLGDLLKQAGLGDKDDDS